MTTCPPRTGAPPRVAEEWVRYADEGFTRIACLDSLFTRPRARLVDLCERLVAAGSPVRWSCCARGDDLVDAEVFRLLAAAGCVQVQVGVESGSPALLAAMDKRTTVQATARGLVACREAGIATFVTVILGFPGETRATLAETWSLLADTAPDFAFATPFTARVSLDPSLFYGAMFSYRRDRHREALLDYQRDALTGTRGTAPFVGAAFAPLRWWSLRRLERDLADKLGGGGVTAG